MNENRWKTTIIECPACKWKYSSAEKNCPSCRISTTEKEATEAVLEKERK